MESAGRSLFLFSSLITTSTHCDCAACRLAPWQSPSMRGGSGDGRPWTEEEEWQDKEGLPACFSLTLLFLQIVVKMRLRGCVRVRQRDGADPLENCTVD